MTMDDFKLVYFAYFHLGMPYEVSFVGGNSTAGQ